MNTREETNAREITTKQDGRCPCGSGQFPYRLFGNTGELLLWLCCHVCEKERRKVVETVDATE